MDILSDAATLPQYFWSSSQKGSTLKGKNLLQMGAYFLFRVSIFQRGLDVQESNEEVTKVASPQKNGGKSSKFIESL